MRPRISLALLLPTAVLGAIAFGLLLPVVDAPFSGRLTTTRSEARAIADRAARELGIEVDEAWVVVSWENGFGLERELAGDSDLRRRASADPVLGPRLGSWRVFYFRENLPKRPEYGWVQVGTDGEVVGARRRPLSEEQGSAPSAETLREEAEAIVVSTPFPGAPDPTFDSLRPEVQRHRTDTTVRFRVPSTLRAGDLAFYLELYWVGDRYAGWQLVEERADGRAIELQTGSFLAAFFLRISVLFGILILAALLFLRKYHAGEVGVGVGALLFAALVVLALVSAAGTGAQDSLYTQIGALGARATAVANVGFELLFLHLPLALLGFLAWAVGESFARERWGERLASFDAILRRDPFNATVGRSVLHGLLASPLAAAASLGGAALAVTLDLARPIAPMMPLTHAYSFGAGAVLVRALDDALFVPVVALLFVLAALRRRVGAGAAFFLAVVVGMFACSMPMPLDSGFVALLFGFGLPAVVAGVFLLYDLLAASVTVFSATLLLYLVPHLQVAQGDAAVGPWIALLFPLGLLLLVGAGGLATRRDVEYRYVDLAPHVRRIVERERVKAEIDAANRIQAALLPSADPRISGVSVASHYRAATEIGGDYFDFLELGDGRVGVAFGDVAGHGLTSGIVMAMAKSALLVQVGVDARPVRVMEVLDDIVQRTAPSRMMMTFFFGLLEPASRRLRFSSAGHLDPYLYRAATGELECLSAWGYPLGLRRREPFRELVVQFEVGDRLVLYSDGLIEAVDDTDEAFGFERFEATLARVADRSAEEIRDTLLRSVRSFTQNRPPEDDQTLVILGFEEFEKIARSA